MTSGWLPLESTPEVLNPYAHDLGLPQEWGFTDVWGLDDELLAMIPQPCVALCLLFPCGDAISKTRRGELREAERKSPAQEKNVFFAAQHDSLGNACGTMAMIHAIANGASDYDLTPGSPLAKFVEATSAMTPAERGHALATHSEIRALSDQTAAAGETSGAGSDDAQDQHFIAFVRGKDGAVYELDGRTLNDQGEAMVVRHGEAEPGFPFLSKIAKIVREDFMKRQPEALNFNVTALVMND